MCNTGGNESPKTSLPFRKTELLAYPVIEEVAGGMACVEVGKPRITD